MTADIRLVADRDHPDFLDLPWGEPLADWQHPRMVKMAHGISRHVVRFVRYDDRVYALKETEPKLAQGEYDILRVLRTEHLPVVEPVGVVTESTSDQATLITRYLDFSLPYWYLFGRDEPALADRLLDAGVVLLVRLHLDNVYWGDCSLSNILFRRDAGAMMAYLVDAETTERTGLMSDGRRFQDIDIAKENIAGGLLDLQAAGRVPAEIDPLEIAENIERRYDQLWNELTRPEQFGLDERWKIEQRIRHINQLGFDVEELAISTDGTELRIKPVLVEEGHHARDLRRRTGLEVQENQARRLLADIEGFRAWLEREMGQPVPAAVAAARWLADIYEPLVQSIPDELQTRLEPPEIFHQMLDHRYHLSERQQREVPNSEALASYLDTVLTNQPAERQLQLTDSPNEPNDQPGPPTTSAAPLGP
ncbi:MAG: DUF4032 domain-containing protein [Acidimicrobiales bacterium]